MDCFGIKTRLKSSGERSAYFSEKGSAVMDLGAWLWKALPSVWAVGVLFAKSEDGPGNYDVEVIMVIYYIKCLFRL